MEVSFRQLRAFVAVAQSGSFTAAAARLYLSQSAVSGLIRDMEQALDSTLFDRNSRRVELSSIGKNLYPLIDKALQDLHHALDGVTNLQALQNGLVHVAVPQMMACTLLPEIIAAYRVEYPHIAIRLIDCLVDQVIPKVFSGEVDFGIGPEREINTDIAANFLFRRSFVAVFPQGHLLAQQKKVRWASLMQYPFIALKGYFTERLSGDLSPILHNLRLTMVSEVAFMSTALAMVDAGLGVAACIPYSDSLIARYRLESRPLTDPTVQRRFYCFTRNGRTLSPAAESFRTYCQRYLAKRR